MNKMRFTLSTFAVLTLTLICVSIAQAQLLETAYVSAIGGEDTNPCTRTEPCSQISRGLQVVATRGLLVVLDSGEYDGFTVNRAVTIEAAPGVVANISIIFVRVDAISEFDVVVLRGLTLNAVRAGGSGINSNSPDLTLHVENCVISGYVIGISILNARELFVKDTIVRDNTIDGISVSSDRVIPTIASIDHCRLESNGGNGLRANDNTRVTIRDSVVAGNKEDGFFVFSSVPGRTAELNIENCVATGNGDDGIEAQGPFDPHNPEAHAPGAFVSVSNSTITNNNNRGIYAFLGGSIHVSNTTITRNNRGLFFERGGTIISFGDNKLFGNRTSDGAFTSTVPKR